MTKKISFKEFVRVQCERYWDEYAEASADNTQEFIISSLLEARKFTVGEIDRKLFLLLRVSDSSRSIDEVDYSFNHCLSVVKSLLANLLN